jgi:hypothetical protein
MSTTWSVIWSCTSLRQVCDGTCRRPDGSRTRPGSPTSLHGLVRFALVEFGVNDDLPYVKRLDDDRLQMFAMRCWPTKKNLTCIIYNIGCPKATVLQMLPHVYYRSDALENGNVYRYSNRNCYCQSRCPTNIPETIRLSLMQVDVSGQVRSDAVRYVTAWIDSLSLSLSLSVSSKSDTRYSG